VYEKESEEHGSQPWAVIDESMIEGEVVADVAVDGVVVGLASSPSIEE
jgi:hypothetical protein